jgi:hypothetical protein
MALEVEIPVHIVTGVEHHPAKANDNEKPTPPEAPGMLWRDWLNQWGTTWAYQKFADEVRG